MAFHEPHEPIASPDKLVDRYKAEAKNENEAQYFANVTNIDAAVGKLMAKLKELEVDDNTLVIFTSDNGPETLKRYRGASRSYGTPGPLRGMKLWTTDAGFRVPGIIRWPAGIKPKQTVSHPVSALDFLPTFCALANAKPPTDRQLDGANFMPATRDKPIERDKPLLWVYYLAINDRRVAMRDGDWKILAKLNISKRKLINGRNAEETKAATLSDFQIFKITEDIGERKDLSKSNPIKLAELTAKLQKQYRELVTDSHVWQ